MAYNPYSIKTIRSFQTSHEKMARKSLGQNYLIQSNVADKIAQNASRLAAGQAIVEIGAGLGSLSLALTKQENKLLSIETEKKSIEILQENIPNLDILHADILKLQAGDLPFDEPVLFCGNLPYHITSPILFYLHENFYDKLQGMVFMLQKEVGDRLIAKPRTKSYGILSVIFQAYFEIKKIMDVQPGCFYPKPKVISSVYSWTPIKKPGAEYPLFKTLVRTAFNFRRKQMPRILIQSENLSEHSDRLKQFFEEKPEWQRARAEELLASDFLTIQAYLQNAKP